LKKICSADNPRPRPPGTITRLLGMDSGAPQQRILAIRVDSGREAARHARRVLSAPNSVRPSRCSRS
jgi:hypothetical protein